MIFLVAVIYLVGLGNCADKTHRKIYYDIKGYGACFRRFNGTSQVGCASGRDGNVGIIHYIKTTEDLGWLVNHGPHQPYIAVLANKNFNQDVIRNLTQSGKINGILVIDSNHSEELLPKSRSNDLTCPNDGYGLYKEDAQYNHCQKVMWNKEASGMTFEDFNFPILLMTNVTETDYLINKCYRRFNAPINGTTARLYPLCAAELRTLMDGAKDTPTCKRRSEQVRFLGTGRNCDPLGDHNIHTMFNRVNKNETRREKSVIIAAAKLDSFSMFHDVTPSADGVVTGLVTLLAAAEALGKIKQEFTSTDVMFTFFQGEAFDYIGSSRMVYDMMKGSFPNGNGMAPIDLTHIAHFVEIAQVGNRDESNLWIHTDPNSLKDDNVSKEVDKIIQTMKDEAKTLGLGLDKTPDSQPLPPSSLQSFLKKANISGIVLTDHKAEYTNKYANSYLDLPQMIKADYPKDLPVNETYDYVTDQAKQLTTVATTVARTLYRLATNKTDAKHIEVSNKTVTHLLYCFLFQKKCELFKTVIDEENKPQLAFGTGPFSMYVSVDNNFAGTSILTRLLLAYYTGNIISNANKENCSELAKDMSYTYNWISGPLEFDPSDNKTKRTPKCVISLTNRTIAKSPAFTIEGYDWSSGEYSTWSESVWPGDGLGARLFLVPSQRSQTVTLSVGVIVFLTSLLLVYFINDRADILFTQNRNTEIM